MRIVEAKAALDKVIDKARVHLYKPIQLAEILYRDRVKKDVNLSDLTTYRTISKKWRDVICLQFLGRTSTSSARYQDDLFNDNAVPPALLAILGEENKRKNGIVEAYIYRKFAQRHAQMAVGLNYCLTHSCADFQLQAFLAQFWREPGLRRSIDKVYEVVVYALFSALLEALELSVEISVNPAKMDILSDFEDFAREIIQLSPDRTCLRMKGKINRQGITNAADRGLDMWANFGIAIQIKHLSLTQELAENIATTISSDRIVIVCKDAERQLILSLLNQIGWQAKIQSIITEDDLMLWYEKAMRGKYATLIGQHLLNVLQEEIATEFPVTRGDDFADFMAGRGYSTLQDSLW